MRRLGRAVLRGGGALLGAYLLFGAWVALRGRPVVNAAPIVAAQRVRGAFHVHTDRSDGHGSVAEIAAAAKRSGLQFAVLTDHNLIPGPSRYLDGVLLVEGVEYTTPIGHIVALPAELPLPKGPLRKSPLQTLRPTGAMLILAHPVNLRLPFADWPRAREAQGLEYLSDDSLWREAVAHPFRGLVWGVLAFPFSRLLGLYQVVERPAEALGHLDGLASRAPMTGLCSVDAHGILPYETSFRSMSLQLDLSGPLTGEADVDTKLVKEAIRAGRTGCSMDGLGDGRGVIFQGRDGAGAWVGPGGVVAAGPGSTLSLRLDYPELPMVETVIYRDGVEVLRSQGNPVELSGLTAGAYRAEVWLKRPRLLFGAEPTVWSYTGFIYVR